MTSSEIDWSSKDYWADGEMLSWAIAPIDADPRTVAILTVAYIEKYLLWVFRAKLPTMNNKTERDLFGADRPLGSLMAKVHLAQAMGFFTEEQARDVSLLARVRNRFAHDLRLSSFEDEQIASICNEISQTWHSNSVVQAVTAQEFKAYAASPRGRFVSASENICMSLGNWLTAVDREQDGLPSSP